MFRQNIWSSMFPKNQHWIVELRMNMNKCLGQWTTWKMLMVKTPRTRTARTLTSCFFILLKIIPLCTIPFPILTFFIIIIIKFHIFSLLLLQIVYSQSLFNLSLLGNLTIDMPHFLQDNSRLNFLLQMQILLNKVG